MASQDEIHVAERIEVDKCDDFSFIFFIDN